MLLDRKLEVFEAIFMTATSNELTDSHKQANHAHLALLFKKTITTDL